MKVTGGEFDVEVSDVLVMLDRIIQHKLLSSTSTSSLLPEDVELQSICQEYNDFMHSCNACDWPDVFLAVINERKVNSELDSLIKRSSFLGLNIVDNNNSVEVSYIMLLIHILCNINNLLYLIVFSLFIYYTTRLQSYGNLPHNILLFCSAYCYPFQIVPCFSFLNSLVKWYKAS